MRILHGVGSRLLGCGCLVGVYETYDQRTVATIDAVGSECRDRSHALHAVLELSGRHPSGPEPAEPRPR